jgi:hypothetical protein
MVIKGTVKSFFCVDNEVIGRENATCISSFNLRLEALAEIRALMRETKTVTPMRAL